MSYARLLSKIVLAGVAFAVAFFFIFLFKQWEGNKRGYFFFVEDWQSLALVLIIAFLVVKAIELLLKWEIHALFFKKGR